MGRNEIRMALLCFAIAVVSGHAVAQPNEETPAGHNNKDVNKDLNKDVPAKVDSTSGAPESELSKGDESATKDGAPPTAPQAIDPPDKSTAHKHGVSPKAKPTEPDKQTAEPGPPPRRILADLVVRSE